MSTFDQSHRSEQAGIGDRPVGGIKRLVADAGEVDIMEDPPFDFVLIQISQAIRSQIGNDYFQGVMLWLEDIGGNEELIRVHDQLAHGLAIDADMCNVTDFAQIQDIG